jgi:hypothetical protein
MKILKQSTAVTIKLGPFVDATDGVTLENALTLTQADFLISKNFGAFAQKNDTSSGTYDAGGYYGVPLNATDTGTLGPLQIVVNESGAMPVWDQYTVVPANVYDSLVSGVEWLAVDANKVVWSISGTTLTVKKQDGTTTSYTKTLTATAGADPITGVS